MALLFLSIPRYTYIRDRSWVFCFFSRLLVLGSIDFSLLGRIVFNVRAVSSVSRAVHGTFLIGLFMAFLEERKIIRTATI